MSLLTKASTVTTPTAYSEKRLHSVKPVESLGSEEVTNGSFDSDLSGWIINNAGTGNIVEWSAGEARLKRIVSVATELKQNALTIGKEYYLRVDVRLIGDLSGAAVEYNGSQRLILKNGVNFLEFTATSTLFSFICLSNTTEYYIDNVSIKEDIGADFSFARASSATRVNEEGYIEKERENLLLQSNTFDTTWSSTDGVTGGQAGYDGSNDAWLFTYATDAAIVHQANTSSGVQTYSVYAKGNVSNGMRLYAFGSSNCFGYFDLNTGSVEVTQNLIDATIEDKGGGWYRCAITFNQTNTQLYMYLSSNSNSNATSGSIYIQDAQLEQGLVATDYIETTTSSVAVGITNDIPRINYEGGIGNFLLEPQRTNRLTNSEYFGDWQISGNITISTNGTTSPEGLQNASIIDFSSATSASNGVYVFAGSPSSAPSRTIYLKGAVGGETLDFSDPNQGGGSNITLTTEWQRFEFTGGNAALCGIWLKNSVGNIIHAYGAQVEEGSYPTSYIPSYGSTVTRAAETCNNAGNSDLFNDSEGVLYAEIAALDESVSSYNSIGLGSGNLNNRIGLGFEPPSSIYVFKRTTSSWLPKKSSEINVFNKVAISYNTNDNHFWLNGFKVSSDTTIGDISQPNELGFEASYGGEDFYGKTKMVSTFTEALSDSELECLTSWSSFNRMATAQNYNIE